MVANAMKEYIGVIFFLMCLQIANSQELKFSEPVKLGPEINSEDEELAPMLSPDGNTLYFARAFHDKNTGGKYAGTDIWISSKDANGNWLPAVNAGKPWNNKRSNAVIGISRDHKTVYLLNAYNNKSGIAFSKLVHDKWTKPEFVPVPGINRDDFVGVYVHPDFDVMVISMKDEDSYGEEDLYVSLKDSLGNWSKPQNLGPTINTKGFEIAPFLTEDKKRIFFSSNDHRGFGNSDLFYSDRLYDSWLTWSAPNSLREEINNSDFQSFLFNSYSDSLVYFTSKTPKGLDLYKSKYRLTKSNDRNLIVLTKGELDEFFGKNYFLDFEYNSNALFLKEFQEEMIWYLISKIISKPNLFIQISFIQTNEAEYFDQRLDNIKKLISKTGIEAYRVIYQGGKQFSSDNKTILRFVFLKSK